MPKVVQQEGEEKYEPTVLYVEASSGDHYHMSCWGGENSPLPLLLLSSYGWTNHNIDTRPD